jgi:hypothetical protein
MNVLRGGHITANIFKEKFWFGKVQTLRVDEFQIQVRNLLPLSHFEF